MVDLRQHYLAYLDALNRRDFDSLGRYVADELTYNAKPLTRQEYEDLLRHDVVAIPDLFYDARLVVIEGDWVACQIHFECTPAEEFMGLAPTGRRVSFDEHVFYRFDDDLIVEVRSVIDVGALREQLTAGGGA